MLRLPISLSVLAITYFREVCKTLRRWTCTKLFN